MSNGNDRTYFWVVFQNTQDGEVTTTFWKIRKNWIKFVKMLQGVFQIQTLLRVNRKPSIQVHSAFIVLDPSSPKNLAFLWSSPLQQQWCSRVSKSFFNSYPMLEWLFITEERKKKHKLVCVVPIPSYNVMRWNIMEISSINQKNPFLLFFWLQTLIFWFFYWFLWFLWFFLSFFLIFVVYFFWFLRKGVRDFFEWFTPREGYGKHPCSSFFVNA